MIATDGDVDYRVRRSNRVTNLAAGLIRGARRCASAIITRLLMTIVPLVSRFLAAASDQTTDRTKIDEKSIHSWIFSAGPSRQHRRLLNRTRTCCRERSKDIQEFCMEHSVERKRKIEN